MGVTLARFTRIRRSKIAITACGCDRTQFAVTPQFCRRGEVRAIGDICVSFSELVRRLLRQNGACNRCDGDPSADVFNNGVLFHCFLRWSAKTMLSDLNP